MDEQPPSVMTAKAALSSPWLKNKRSLLRYSSDSCFKLHGRRVDTVKQLREVLAMMRPEDPVFLVDGSPLWGFLPMGDRCTWVQTGPRPTPPSVPQLSTFRKRLSRRRRKGVR